MRKFALVLVLFGSLSALGAAAEQRSTWEGGAPEARFARENIAPALRALLSQKLKPEDPVIPQFSFGPTRKNLLASFYKSESDRLKALAALEKGDLKNFIQVASVQQKVEVGEAGENVTWIPYDFRPESIVRTESTAEEAGAHSYLTFLGGDVFPAFIYQRFGKGKMKTPELYHSLIASIAWMERVEAKDRPLSYKLHREHGGRRILENYLRSHRLDKIELYRGAFPAEGRLLQIAHKLTQGEEPGREQIDALKGALSEGAPQALRLAVTQLGRTTKIGERKKQGQTLIAAYAKMSRGGLFFTPVREYAERFSKGGLIKVVAGAEDLKQLYALGNLYVGIEDALEISFIGDAGVNALVANPTLEASRTRVSEFAAGMDGGEHSTFEYESE